MSNIIFFFWLFAKISFFTFGGGYATFLSRLCN